MNERLTEVEAVQAVEALTTTKEVACPWRGEVSRAWRTLALILAVATMLGSISTGFLAVTVLANRNADDAELAKDACYQAIDSHIDRAAAVTRRTSARVDNLFGDGLIRSDEITDDDGALLPEVRAEFDEALRENATAVADDDAANEFMQDWLNAGRPLPCPYPPDIDERQEGEPDNVGSEP